MSLPLDKDVEDRILAAFRDRDVPVKRSDLIQALHDDGFRAWATKHLVADNLLTKDELKLYTNLESSGQLKVIQAQQQQQPPVRPFLDPEIREAIEVLRESTAATVRQTEILRIQCRKLEEKMRWDADLKSAEGTVMRRLYDKLTMEQQRCTREVEDCINDVELILPPAEASIAAERSTVLPQVSGILKEHDRVLELLEKSSVFEAKEPDTNEEEQHIVKRMRILTDFLVKYTADTVRSRLDRVYLESIIDPANDGLLQEGISPDEIEEEIDTLYADIDDLIAMIIHQQHEVPILQAIRLSLETRRNQVIREFDFVCDAMDQIIHSMVAITERLKTRQSYRVALHHLSGLYRDALANRPETFGSSNNRIAARRQTSKIRNPVGLGITSASTTASSQSNAEGTALPGTLTALLKQQGISTSNLSNGGEYLVTSSTPPFKTIRLETALRGKKEEILETIEDSKSLSQEVLLSYLRPAETTSQLVADALMADTKFQTSLINEDQEQELEDLSRKTGRLRKRLGELDADVVQRRDLARKEFMRRWAVDIE
ncbi:hypothetical protein KEM54_004434 [Ascosphaera aggregata]|nr:hypothetical protein KEM54_004434 [Ascosphaera aggregata]